MTSIHRTAIISILLWLILPNVAPARANDLRLWYQQPAENWVEALPIGNGSMGAMVFGRPVKEHIQFNEDSVWAGGPEDYINPKAGPEVLREVRQLLFDGKQRP